MTPDLLALTTLEPDSTRSARVRQRCLARLAPARRPLRPAGAMAVPLILGAVSMVYAMALVGTTLALQHALLVR